VTRGQSHDMTAMWIVLGSGGNKQQRPKQHYSELSKPGEPW